MLSLHLTHKKNVNPLTLWHTIFIGALPEKCRHDPATANSRSDGSARSQSRVLDQEPAGMGEMKGEKAITSSPRHVDPLSATDARRRDIWPEDVWFLDPSKGRATLKTEGSLCSWPTPEGLTRAMSHDTFTRSINGQTLEGSQ